jgi:hypothetical protein
MAILLMNRKLSGSWLIILLIYVYVYDRFGICGLSYLNGNKINEL